MLFETISAIDLLSTFGGWGMVTVPRLDDNQEEVGLDVFLGNPNMVDGEWDGRWKFFVTDTSDDSYGAPRIIQEPSLSITAPDGSGQIVGAIIVNAAGEVVMRASWSNLVFIQNKAFVLDTDGNLTIDDQLVGTTMILVAPDKNRLYGNDGKAALVAFCIAAEDDRIAPENYPDIDVLDLEALAVECCGSILESMNPPPQD
jgi:hypothetical protein